MKDEIYRAQSASGDPPGRPFAFDAKTAQVFEDMIRRSVPGYGLTLEMIGVVAQQVFGAEGGRCYDLGCSLGASMLPVLEKTRAQLIGVDCSAEMLHQARAALAAYAPRVELREERIEETALEAAKMIVLNFTLQFLPKQNRAAFLRKCYDALQPEGVLVLSEKVVNDDPDKQEALVALHHQFKASQGYSALEIARKRDAIETVLLAESAEVHLRRLKEAGFRNVFCWFQCFNFCSFLAEK